METQTITIIGLGRLGVSIGLAIKNSPLDVTVIGHDIDRDRAQKVQDEVGAVDKIEWNVVNAARKADILVLAIPASELEATLNAVGQDLQEHTLVIDLSPQKGVGVKWAKKYITQGHYVGAVPVLPPASMADGRTDVTTASADLFRNGGFCLVPSASVEPAAVETAVNFGLLLGATPFFLDPDEYDSLLQGTETLPNLAAAAMFSAIHKATGWRDILRLAGQSFALSTRPLENEADIAFLALHNREASLRWLDAMMDELKLMRQWVHEGDLEMFTLYLKELGDERFGWLALRERNEWDERETTDVQHRSFSERMLGGFVTGSSRKNGER